MSTLPTFAALHITESCTHHCPYCYAGKGLGSRLHADFSKLCSIILELEKYNFKSVALLGGDPAKYIKIYELLEFIKEHTHIEVELLSNTLEIADHTPEEIAPFVNSVETTIHGTASFHDNLCGCPGAFVTIVKKLRQYQNLGKIINIDLNITPQNINEIYKVLEYLFVVEKLNIKNVLIQRIIPTGNAEGSLRYKLTKFDLNNAFEQIEKAQKKYGFTVKAEDTFPFCAVNRKYHKFLERCQWGYSKMAINGDGDISRCGADPRFALGNILQNSLPEIWNNSTELKVFKEKQYLPENCKKCKYLERCGGGCPLSSFLPNYELGQDYLCNANI